MLHMVHSYLLLIFLKIVFAQINVRIERTSLHTIVFSSQKRCISSTKTFTGSTGYGCFGYVPIFWMEESRVIRDTEFRALFVHYYTRPGKYFSTR